MAVKKPKTKNKNKHSNDLRVKTNHDTAVGSNMTTLPGTQARRGGSPLGTLGRAYHTPWLRFLSLPTAQDPAHTNRHRDPRAADTHTHLTLLPTTPLHSYRHGHQAHTLHTAHSQRHSDQHTHGGVAVARPTQTHAEEHTADAIFVPAAGRYGG